MDQDGGDFIFPEAFQLDVNEVEYVNGSLQVHNYFLLNIPYCLRVVLHKPAMVITMRYKISGFIFYVLLCVNLCICL